jgi:hypothetical protein
VKIKLGAGGKPLMAGGKVVTNCDCCGAVPTGTGACCTGASCDITTQSACVSGGGIYYGDDTLCAPNPCVCDCCFVNRIQFNATVTATRTCGGGHGTSCPCDAGDFTVTGSPSVNVSGFGCDRTSAQADAGTDFTCTCPTGSPNSDSHAEITINYDGLGGCQFYVAGWIDILNCGSIFSLRMGRDYVSPSMSCAAVYGHHHFSFSGTTGDGDPVSVIMDAMIT